MASQQNNFELAPIDRNQAFETVRDLLVKAEPRIAGCLPKHLTAERLVRVALTTIQTNPKILLCSALSIVGCVVQASELGLELNGFLGEAYMVPFYNGKTKRMEAQFQAGYRGLISLARRSGEISYIKPVLVYEWDEFQVFEGTDARIEHKPAIDHPDRGIRFLADDPNQTYRKGDLIGLRGAYAVVRYKDGATDFEYLTFNRLDELRSRSKARDKETGVENGPWTTDPGEMYRKVPIRQLAKRLPLSPEFLKAAVLDEYGEAGVRQDLGGQVEANPVYSDIVASLVASRTKEHADALAAKYVKSTPAPVPATPTPASAAATPSQIADALNNSRYIGRRRPKSAV